MWWTNGMRLPALVTTGPNPNTSVLYGNLSVLDDGRSGVRTTLGMRIGECSRWDVQFDYLTLGERVNGFSQTSLGSPILARPFFNVETNLQDNLLVANPGTNEGSISVSSKEYFQSAGFAVSYNLCSSNICGEGCDTDAGAECDMPLSYGSRTDLLMGLRYYNLNNSVGINENTRTINPDATFVIQDNFRARNDFYGSEIGMRSLIYRGKWSFEVLTKIAAGNTHSTVTINGQTSITAPNQATQLLSGGVLAGSTNSGTYQRDAFTMIPQLGIEVGYQVNCHWRAFVGYNVLYWGSVFNAADQIDLNVDPRNFPPPIRGGLPFPAYPDKSTNFWAHGINLGTEFRY
jgi:hypothetical protein